MPCNACLPSSAEPDRDICSIDLLGACRAVSMHQSAHRRRPASNMGNAGSKAGRQGDKVAHTAQARPSQARSVAKCRAAAPEAPTKPEQATTAAQNASERSNGTEAHNVNGTATSAQPSSAPARNDIPQYPRDDIGKAPTEKELQDYLALYRAQPIERTYHIPESDIQGTIPADLNGTLYRNGPGNFEFGGQKMTHPFDGDGLIASYAFQDGGILARRRFVRTAALREELTAGKLLYKGAFQVGDPSGRWQNPFDLAIRQPANTGVLDWAGKVLALFERDLPYVLTPALDTHGPSTLDVWQKGDYVAAHYRVTETQGGEKRLVTMAPAMAGRDAKVKFVELDEAGSKVAETSYTAAQAGFGFFHDFLITDNYYVLLENPMRLDVWRLLSKYTFGKACIAECLKFRSDLPMKIHCVPRPGSKAPKLPVYTAKAKFAFHHANAYERNGAVVVDTFARSFIDFGKGFDDFTTEMYSHAESCTTWRRIVCRGSTEQAQEHDLRQAPGLANREVEFPAQLPPSHAGRPVDNMILSSSRETHTAGGGMLQEVCKVHIDPGNGVDGPFDPSAVKVDRYYPGDKRYCSEPIFIPRDNAKSPDDGYVCTMVHDLSQPGRAHGSADVSWEILDGLDVGAGPVATFKLKDFVPPGLHGSWSRRYAGPQPSETIPNCNDILADGL